MCITSKAAIAAVLCLGISATSLAEDSPIAPFLGTYRNASVGQSIDSIGRAIDQATDDMGLIVRTVARKRLKKVNPANSTIRISEKDGEITTDFDGLRYVAEANGKPRVNKDPDGGKVEVSYRWDGRTLQARYKAKDGEKVYQFTPDAEHRRLSVHVTVRSPRLPEPVSYTLAFLTVG